MENRKIEVTVGFFLIIVIFAVLFLCIKVANVSAIGGHSTYRIYAVFDNIGGLNVRSPIKIGGVVVGRVAKISLSAFDATYKPFVTIDIDKQYNQIPSSSALSIKTSGLLGEQFIAIDLGITNQVIDEIDGLDASGDVAETQSDATTAPYWQESALVYNTKPAMVLEDLIGQFLYKSDSTRPKSTNLEEK